MRKVLVMIMMSTLLLAGCGTTTTTKDDKETTTAQDKSGFSYTVNGVTIPVGKDFSGALLKLGEPDEYNEAASCYFDGMDKQYYYDGFEIKTYPVGDKDYVQDICISKDSYSTPEGVTVGSTLDDVLKAYGDGYSQTGKMYNYYVSENEYMYFFIMNDVVKYFGYAVNATN